MKFFDWVGRLKRRDKTLCCQDVEELSSDYMDEGLAPSMAAEFKAHMDSCPDCNTFYATFRATVLTLRGLPRRSAPPGLRDRIRSQIASDSSTGRPEASA